jgi:ubiquinone/menaquinone biosynthesis C-methylase UbiE
MKWYDLFSTFYDTSLEKLYLESRKRAIELLDLKDGQIVIDIACGTGANFKHIKSQNLSLKIYATDFSNGMLRRAQDNIIKNEWNDITLFQADARKLDAKFIEQKIKTKIKFDRIICCLGFSVIPDWEMVLDNMIDLLNEDGKLVIIDVFAAKRDFNTWLVELFAKADLDRAIYQLLEKKTRNFNVEFLPIKESKVGGKLFVAVGKKNTEENP